MYFSLQDISSMLKVSLSQRQTIVSHTESQMFSSPMCSTRWTSGKRRTKNTPLQITIFTAAFMWNNRFITRCSCHLCRLLSNLSFYRLFCCWIICQVWLQVSGVQIIITAVFLFLSFCLTGDWFCQFHRLHVPWNMPRPFYLLSFSADAVLEQETLQQGVYRNSWWVHLNVCPSIPLSWPRRVLIWQDLEYQCC